MAKSAKPSQLIVTTTYIQPSFMPRVGKPGRLTNCLKQFETFLNSIQNTIYCKYFLKPVDTVLYSVPNYYNIIKEPMDIGTIFKRMKNKYYFSVTEAFADLQQVLRNCFTYNNSEHDCYNCGIRLKRAFQQNLLKYTDKEEECLPVGQRHREQNQQTVTTEPPAIEELPPHIDECQQLLDTFLYLCPKSLEHFAKPLDIKRTHSGDRYVDVILEPMDYLTITTKLKYLLYKDLNELFYDISLMHLNGFKLYKCTDDIYQVVVNMCSTLESIMSFYDKYGRLPEEMDEYELYTETHCNDLEEEFALSEDSWEQMENEDLSENDC